MKQDEPFETKASEALELGVAYLDVESGFLTRADIETNHWETVVSTDGSNGLVPAGTKTELGGTHCRQTLERDSPLALHNAPKQGFADPDDDGFHCYHGTTLTVSDEAYGTVCFVARNPRGEPFSEAETMFAELVGRLLEHELDYQRQQDELARQTGLVNVLDRVLRHNIRNEMTVIRANAQMHGEKDGGCPECEKIVSSADDLIGMSETARNLSKMLNSEFDRRPVDVATLAREIASEATDAYPALSITVEAPDRLTVPALPSLETALWELIDNATEYAGPEPAVTITVRQADDSVEIVVADDGPGLPKTERDVLHTGTETPLVHGSGLGLWSVYWVATGHHGEIGIDTEDGTAITISLPASGAESHDDQPLFQRAADRYQRAFEHTPTGLLLVDDACNLIEANDKAVELLGESPEQLVGRNLSDVADDRPEITESEETGMLTTADGQQVSYRRHSEIVSGLQLLVLDGTGTE